MISIIILIEVKYYHQKLVTTVDELVWTQYGSDQAICLSLPLSNKLTPKAPNAITPSAELGSGTASCCKTCAVPNSLDTPVLWGQLERLALVLGDRLY